MGGFTRKNTELFSGEGGEGGPSYHLGNLYPGRVRAQESTHRTFQTA